jgi:hypothetical protein
MDLAFRLLTLGHIRMYLLMFVLAGISAYYIDYRQLKGNPEFTREAAFLRVTTRVFVIGGIAILVAYQFLMWFS